MDTKATGALIADRRKRLALSQAELAERLHVTDKAVSRWETGRGMPGLDSLEPLSEILGLSVSELLSGKELTTEELSKAAGGQIMEGLKREHRWKWMALLAIAAVTLSAIWGIGASVRARREEAERHAHYAGSVDSMDRAAQAGETAAYFKGLGSGVRFHAASLKVRDWTMEEDYMALLLSDRGGEWCMSLWQKDELYPERYRIIGGRSSVEPGIGGLMVWNFGDAENAVVVVSGAELPEESERYTWHVGSTTYGRIVNWNTRTVLDIFVMSLPEQEEQPFYRPSLYGEGGSLLHE